MKMEHANCSATKVKDIMPRSRMNPACASVTSLFQTYFTELVNFSLRLAKRLSASILLPVNSSIKKRRKKNIDILCSEIHLTLIMWLKIECSLQFCLICPEDNCTRCQDQPIKFYFNTSFSCVVCD